MPLFKTEHSSLNYSCSIVLRFLSFLVTLVVCQFSIAQVSDQTTYVEETVVTGQRSLSSQRVQLETAQNGIFDLFNEIYAGTDYEMMCEREKQIHDGFNPTSGPWTVRACRSSFVRELREQAAEDYIEAAEGIISFDEVEYDRALAQHKEETANRIRELYDTNPEFREQFTNYVTMRTKYQEALEADAEKGNFFTNLFRSKDSD